MSSFQRYFEHKISRLTYYDRKDPSQKRHAFALTGPPSVPKVGWEDLIFQVQVVTPPVTAPQSKRSKPGDRNAAMQAVRNSGTPSSFAAGGWQEVSPNLVLHHRPANQTGAHVAMYWPRFGVLHSTQQAVTVVDAADDVHVANILVAMSDVYPREAARMEVLRAVIGEYFGLTIDGTVHDGTNTDGSVRVRTRFGMATPVLIEGKNELGCGGEPLQQCISMHSILCIKELAADIEQVSNIPALLLQLVGPHVFVFGAVSVPDGTVRVDLLAQVSMLMMPDDAAHREQIVKFWRATKNLTAALVDYYKQLPGPDRDPAQLRFPSGCAQVSFSATIPGKHNVFSGTLTADGQPVIVKIVPRYGREAHTACGTFAPRLLDCFKVEGSFLWAVIMCAVDSSCGVCSLRDFLLTATAEERAFAYEQCQAALQQLHARGYVHGDLRADNILILREADTIRVVFIDFDWSGPEDTVTYPFLMNTKVGGVRQVLTNKVGWPVGAHAGALIKKEHDRAWLEHNFSITLIPQPDEMQQ